MTASVIAREQPVRLGDALARADGVVRLWRELAERIGAPRRAAGRERPAGRIARRVPRGLVEQVPSGRMPPFIPVT
jgi:hypothetical protein